MIITVSFLGIILCVLTIFFLNKYKIICFHYPEVLVEDQQGGMLKLLTYNVAGLPEGISSAITKRYDSMLIIGERINEFDIVNVQEDFNYNIQLYTNNKHPYKTVHRGKAIWGDGLNTFSKYPIEEFRRVSWKKCNSSDCLTPKGFSLSRIRLAQKVVVDVYNVHATAGNSISASKARRRNLLQLATYIEDHSGDRPLIVMGDFNAHYQYNLDNMFAFVAQTKVQDSWVSTILHGTYPVVQEDFHFISDLACNNATESIDKILFRNSAQLEFEVLEYNIDQSGFLDKNRLHLSDHLAVFTSLKWSLKTAE